MNYPRIEWKEGNLEEGLQTLETYAIDFATNHKNYYKNNAANKRWWAKTLRITAILAGAVAGILPILSQMSRDNTRWSIDPAWSTVAVTVAITAIGLDRFFGFSSGWIRFITTEIKLQAMTEHLRLQIENERFSWQGQAPTFDKAKETLAIIVRFLNDVSDIVKDETNTWVIEFQNVLQKFNEELNVKAEASKLGGIKASILNGEQCTDGLTIHVEGQQPVTFFGSSYSVNNLYPKIYRVSVTGNYVIDEGGKKLKKEMRDETLVNVAPGAVIDVTLTMK